MSDNARVDEREPEVLLEGLHHGDEHLSAELVLATLRWLVDGYASDARVRRIVDSREIHLVPMTNPDGGEYDIRGGRYHRWRKDRRPNGDGTVGTDLNRNWGYRWGCCRGSSGDPGARSYRGPRPWSSPETAALRRFVLSRRVDGRQQIRIAVSFHRSGRFIMFPFHYTSADLPADMRPDDRRTFLALARGIVARNGYRPFQGGDMYRADGTFYDWAYARQRIFAFIFELGPLSTAPAPDELIAPESARNRKAILWLLERAACPYAPAGLAPTYCSG